MEELQLMTWIGGVALEQVPTLRDVRLRSRRIDLLVVGVDGLLDAELQLLATFRPSVIAIGDRGDSVALQVDHVLSSKLTSRQLKQAIREVVHAQHLVRA